MGIWWYLNVTEQDVKSVTSEYFKQRTVFGALVCSSKYTTDRQTNVNIQRYTKLYRRDTQSARLTEKGYSDRQITKRWTDIKM